MQRIEKKSALNKIDDKIKSKLNIISVAKSCHYSKTTIERKERELEELYEERNKIKKS
ncbi:MAG: hypothetical protein Unbinned6284contig1004_15 [Prokaryotic dsDNA virus sp.]|nr:MAG: hypothetical protein Unbinned6284contig1004_15 [Prokaryotic dsDNA virus sp.]|tara:strand:- start:29043 stop:29216 length:174 start_codon:yes stop_codon:yes gene_type:complete